jgi:cold-inducible RNA-binding protein
MGRRLYIGNLPYQTTDEQLTSLFSKAGAVETVQVMRDNVTGRARGFAFVEMATDEGVQKAIADFHEFPLDGRALVVNEARPKTPGGPRSYSASPVGGGGAGRQSGDAGEGSEADFIGGRRREPRW